MTILSCHEEVSRGGWVQPCDKMAVARKVDLGGGEYPVCAHHTSGDLVLPIVAEPTASLSVTLAGDGRKWRVRCLVCNSSLYISDLDIAFRAFSEHAAHVRRAA